MKPPVFLTGATGFLGMEVMARLLERGDREVIALVRAADDAAAQERLDGILAKLWADPSPYRDRARAVAGDVTSPGLGMDAGTRSHGRRGGGRGHALRGLDLLRPAAGRGAGDQRRGHARDHRLRARGQERRPPGSLHPRLDGVRGRHHRGHLPRAPARRGPGVPQHVRADEVGGRARRQRGVGPRSRDRAALDRDGRVRVGLDAGLQRPVLADPGLLARALHRGPGAPGGAGGRRPGRLRRRRAGVPAGGLLVLGRREPGVRPRGVHRRRAGRR